MFLVQYIFTKLFIFLAVLLSGCIWQLLWYLFGMTEHIGYSLPWGVTFFAIYLIIFVNGDLRRANALIDKEWKKVVG